MKKEYIKPTVRILTQKWKDITWFLETKLGELHYQVYISDFGNIYIPEYEVDFGNVKRTIKSKYIIPNDKNWSGYYYYIFMNKKRKRTAQTIHRLVYIGFNGLIEDGLVIDHIDGNKYNNRLSNLNKTTPKGNNNNPITKQRYKDSMVLLYKDPIRGNEVRQKISKTTKEYWSKKESRETQSQRLKRYHKIHPENHPSLNRKWMSNGVDKAYPKPEEFDKYIEMGYHFGMK